MNLIEITEQLKNPAVSVQQLMQYANNSNPQVPSYVALAEMQRRQSMQAPPQAPQQTVKDQLGASLMGLPAAPGASPNPAPNPAPGAAPQQPPQQPQQGMQPEQVPMPEPKPALPTQPGMQPGMAGGGLTSIPLNMHHDFAAGGIIAFADGGYPEGMDLRKEQSRDELRQEREAEEAKYGISKDPYLDVKRRYADIEAKQKKAEAEGDSNRLWSGLAAYAASGTKGFGESAGAAAKVMQDERKRQETLGEQNAMKMAELQTAFAEKEDARRRGDMTADRAAEDKIRTLNKEMLGIRNQYTSAEAAKTSAAASTKQAETASQREMREAETEKIMRPLDIKYKNALINQAGRPPAEVQMAEKYWQSMPRGTTFQQAYDAMMSTRAGGKGTFTFEDAMKLAAPGGVPPGMDPKEYIDNAKKILEAHKMSLGNPYSGASNDEIKAALAKLGIK